MRMIVAPYNSIADATGVRLTTDIDGEVQMTVRASEVQLVVSNLLDNAVRYSAAGGLVQVSGRRAGATYVIEISDNGCGIPNAALPNIYDRFFGPPHPISKRNGSRPRDCQDGCGPQWLADEHREPQGRQWRGRHRCDPAWRIADCAN